MIFVTDIITGKYLAMYYKREDWIGNEQCIMESIFKYFRDNGFPHFDIPIDQQKKDIENLKKYMSKNNIIQGNTIKQTMHCMGLCWSYHPHHWNIRCGNSRTPMEVFNDDVLLRKAIAKRMKTGYDKPRNDAQDIQSQWKCSNRKQFQTKYCNGNI